MRLKDLTPPETATKKGRTKSFKKKNALISTKFSKCTNANKKWKKIQNRLEKRGKLARFRAYYSLVDTVVNNVVSCVLDNFLCLCRFGLFSCLQSSIMWFCAFFLTWLMSFSKGVFQFEWFIFTFWTACFLS